VVGHQGEQVIEYSEQVYGHRVQFVWQKEQLGTAHAVMQAKKALSGFDGQVIILYGDVPLLGVETPVSLSARFGVQRPCWFSKFVSA
jgi:bifunctional UDP-N-acetylglucosamine pyrophosphorylase/glucosamine-1-phosphate N-acetyltransferase